MAFRPPANSSPAPDQSSFYQPLKSERSIRLLCVKCEYVTQGIGSIEFAIEEYDLDKHPPYDCLSYTWGQPYYSTESRSDDHKLPEFETYDYSVLCDGKPFWITKNMSHAFQALIQPCEVEYLWIDAVCINQADVEHERAAQVALMGEIFASATRVLLWLGHHIPQFDDLIWSTTVFLDAISRLEDEHGSGFVETQSILDREFVESLGLENVIWRLRRAADFCGRCRVFDRAWIVQEAAKAAGLGLFCGTQEIVWERFLRLGELFEDTTWSKILLLHPLSRTAFMMRSPGGSAIHWRRLQSSRMLDTSDPKIKTDMDNTYLYTFGATKDAEKDVLTLLNAIAGLRDYRASDPRDKIYAALGLATHLRSRKAPEIFKITYTSSSVEVYLEFAMLMIENLPGLWLFSFLDNTETHLSGNWPSWVPDWSNPSSLSALHRISASCDIGFNVWGFNIWEEPLAEQCATNVFDSRTLKLEGELKAQLNVQGVMVTSIDAIVEVKRQSKWYQVYEAGLCMLELCLQLPRPSSDQGSTNRLEILWRTNILDSTVDGEHPAPAYLAHAFGAWTISLMGESFYYGAEEGIDMKALKARIAAICSEFEEEIAAGLFPSLMDVEYFDGLIRSFYSAESEAEELDLDSKITELYRVAEPYVRNAIHFQKLRKLFRTGNHKNLGEGPQCTKPGDLVWFIKGATTPIILRPIDDRSQFRVVGECYLHGCMFGELFKDGQLNASAIQGISLI